MSRRPRKQSSRGTASAALNHHHHQQQQHGDIEVVHDHDVLSGRGVNIAEHPGNQRFRTLVTTRADETYCTQYLPSEKRALAEEIIKHIQGLDPPGRFLRRDKRHRHSNRGLTGPWAQLTFGEAVKKTCQALRDCNRQDREGYASGVVMPEDVQEKAKEQAQLGLSVKEQAEAAAAARAVEVDTTLYEAVHGVKRRRSYEQDQALHQQQDRVSPSVENAAEWLKKQRTDDISWPRTSASNAVSDFSSTGACYQDESTHDQDAVDDSTSVYATGDLFARAPSADDDAEVEEAVGGGSDDAGGYGYRINFNPYAQFPSLSASEEAMARELAYVGGINMSLSATGAFNTSGGGLNMNATGYSSTTGGINMGGTGGTSSMTGSASYNANPSGSGLNANTTGGLNIHNMNDF